MNQSLTISVPSGLARFADHYGTRLAEFRKSSRHRNNLVRDSEHDLWMNILGTRGEAALYWFLGGFFGGAKWDTSISNDRVWGNTPDIIYRGESYDAKGIDRNKLSLVVYPKGLHLDWRYVLVGTQFWPEAELLGWCFGLDVKSVGLQEKVKHRPAYFVQQKSKVLRPCSELPAATSAERCEAFFSYLPEGWSQSESADATARD